MTRLPLVALLLTALVSPAFAAGDVTSAVSGRTLTLTGDDAANSLTVTPGGTTDSFTVTPTNGTTLDGSAAAAVFRHIRNITALMGAGDDVVSFTSVNVRGNVHVRLDDGADSLYFTGTAIRGRTTVRCGAGTDLVRTDGNAIFYGPVNVRGEAGNDELQFVASQFRNRLHVEGNADDDHVLLSSVTCSATARTEVQGNRGIDFLEIQYSTFGTDVWADMGPDDDRVRVAYSRFGIDVSLYGGAGFDDALSLEAGNTYVRFQDYGGFEEGQPRL